MCHKLIQKAKQFIFGIDLEKGIFQNKKLVIFKYSIDTGYKTLESGSNMFKQKKMKKQF
jgi:hypothetical protein